MNDATPNTTAEIGKVITLGAVFAEYKLADGKTLKIRRMGMNKEMRFVELYKKFVAMLNDQRDSVLGVLNEYMTGASKVQFGVLQGLELLGDLFGQLPALQNFAIEGVQIVAQANGVEMSAEWLKDNLSTADCFQILGSQAEVQGLLSSFRGILASLSSLSTGKG